MAVGRRAVAWTRWEKAMTDAERCRTQCLNRPLSRRYGFAVSDVLNVRLRDANGLRDQSIRWAFGWLADGQGEALGAWLDPADGTGDPHRLLADLRARGVERIWHLAGTGTGTAQVLERASKPEQLEAEQVRAGLARAIRRHGSFESAAAGLDFVTGVLQRAEFRLDRERLIAKGTARLDSGVQMASPAL
jgi:hypothetical protein